jgi:hypothetical protein
VTRAGRAVQLSAKSVEHYGPPWLADASREVLGGIDLDPSSCSLANTIIKADHYYGLPEDGFVMPWGGRMYVNPPGGKQRFEGRLHNRQALWYSRLAAEWEEGEIESAIFVVFNLELFKYAQRYPVVHPVDLPICYPSARVRFHKPAHVDGAWTTVEQKSPGHPNAIVFLPPVHHVIDHGECFETFARTFSQFGKVKLP